MTGSTVPEFSTRAWNHHPEGSGGVDVSIGAGGSVDIPTVLARCSDMVDELAALIGLPGAVHLAVASSDVVEPGGVIVSVCGTARAVSPAGTVVGHRHRTGWGLGLPPVEELAVATVERVLLDDPALLLPDDVPPEWIAGITPHPELPVTAGELRELLGRHVLLTDLAAVRSAVALAGSDTDGLRLARRCALLTDPGLVVEVPSGAADEQVDRAVAVVAESAGHAAGFGMVLTATPEVRRSDAALLAPAGLGDRMRVLLGGLPLAIGPLDDPKALAVGVVVELIHAAGRTCDEVATGLRLDRLATVYPGAVDALRRRWPDVVVAEVLRELADDVPVADLVSVVDRLVTAPGPDVARLVDQLRGEVVERYLAEDPTEARRTVYRLPTAFTLQLTSDQSVPRASEAALVEALLQAVAGRFPGAAWSMVPALIVVDGHELRRTVRRRLRVQAPDLLVLQAAEVPVGLPTLDGGELEIAGM